MRACMCEVKLFDILMGSDFFSEWNSWTESVAGWEWCDF